MGQSILPENNFYKILRETLFLTKNKTIEKGNFWKLKIKTLTKFKEFKKT